MEEILTTLRLIQKDLENQKIAIKENGIEVTKTVTENMNLILDEKLNHIEQKYKNLEDQLEKQEKRINILEKQARNRNIVFFGIEKQNSFNSYLDLETEIINLISRYLGIKLDRKEIQEIRKIGKNTEKPRPIVVTLTTVGKKIEIFKQKKLLKDTNYYIKEDYPQHILEKRRQLQEQVKIERAKGNKAILKYDKLVIIGKHEINNTPGNNKRSLPTSPEIYNRNESSLRTQPKKKNKAASSTPQNPTSGSENMVKPGILNYLANKNQTNQVLPKNNSNQ
ncbi:hypothetical protein RR48_07290 [Papilio machaon]|uniref:Endonuclease-reverse transcriptase n=1 Tax=Papilio machaon TaxID=76193 RepID=A0A194RRA2_PAPMA|nr:hypothetical protein RR48_07290 [Papilio machaon]